MVKHGLHGHRWRTALSRHLGYLNSVYVYHDYTGSHQLTNWRGIKCLEAATKQDKIIHALRPQLSVYAVTAGSVYGSTDCDLPLRYRNITRLKLHGCVATES
jgi:hypothetical protein